LARYIGSVCRLCRREGMKLFLKGDRCYSDKCAVDRRPEKTPGEHGHLRPKFSEFAIRLREKQKVKRIYGLTERQFRKYIEKASRSKGETGKLLISLLERRLDNVLYRLGFASSRKEARHIARFGHILVNGKRVDVPSYQIKEGDVIEVAEKSSVPQAMLQCCLLYAKHCNYLTVAQITGNSPSKVRAQVSEGAGKLYAWAKNSISFTKEIVQHPENRSQVPTPVELLTAVESR